MMQCEECGKSNVPILVVVISLKDKQGTSHTDSLYICKECLESSQEAMNVGFEYYNESKTVH
tara:strand:+ start:804 stop:989 length:186 start_codon:yes stop_codon:yes gene_type:complete